MAGGEGANSGSTGVAPVVSDDFRVFLEGIQGELTAAVRDFVVHPPADPSAEPTSDSTDPAEATTQDAVAGASPSASAPALSSRRMVPMYP